MKTKIKLKNKSKTNTKFKLNEKASLLYSLKTRLAAGFVIPLFFVALVGIFAYQKASSGILSNYENSAMQTIQMTTQYMDFGFQTIEADALQMFNDDTIVGYALNQYKDDLVETKKAIDYSKNLMMMKEVSNPFIEDIHIITSSGINCITTASVKDDGTTQTGGFYAELLEEQNTAITSKASVEKWTAQHPLLDTNFVLDADKYICSQYRMLLSGNAAVVVDVSTEQIKTILESMELGENSRLAFITADGREAVIAPDEFSFLNQTYYQNAVSGGEASGSEYVRVQGREYLFMYSVCESNNAVICALVPKSFLLKDAESLKTTCVLLISLSCIIVFLLGMLIMMNISKSMNGLTKRLSNVAEGNLTVDMNLGSRSEFGVLANYIMNMIRNTKNLITQALHIIANVTESVEEVSVASGSLKESTAGIERAIEEINQGMGQQAEDAGRCLQKMDNLSAMIVGTGESVSAMQDMVEKTGERVLHGNKQMLQLKEKETETSDITGQVADWIGGLLTKSGEIEKFVESIRDISEETTLLSLNASIEAARAGESGRGFAVVAEQIKKLADDSLKSSKEIERIVKEIMELMQSTMEASMRAKETVEAQDRIVLQTEDIFTEIYAYMENIQKNTANVSKSMQEMMQEREATLDAVESISGVLQQTAASSAYVKEMVANQMEQVQSVERRVDGLEENTKQLTETVQLFIVE